MNLFLKASRKALNIDDGVGNIARKFLESTAHVHYEKFQSDCLEAAQGIANYGNAFSNKLSDMKSIACKRRSRFSQAIENSSFCNFIEGFIESSRLETKILTQLLDSTSREAVQVKAFSDYMNDFESEADNRLSYILMKLKLQNESTKICFFIEVSQMAESLNRKLDEQFQSLFDESSLEFSNRLNSSRETASSWKSEIISSFNECLRRPEYRQCLDNYVEVNCLQ